MLSSWRCLSQCQCYIIWAMSECDCEWHMHNMMHEGVVPWWWVAAEVTEIRQLYESLHRSSFALCERKCEMHVQMISNQLKKTMFIVIQAFAIIFASHFAVGLYVNLWDVCANISASIIRESSTTAGTISNSGTRRLEHAHRHSFPCRRRRTVRSSHVSSIWHHSLRTYVHVSHCVSFFPLGPHAADTRLLRPQARSYREFSGRYDEP